MFFSNGHMTSVAVGQYQFRPLMFTLVLHIHPSLMLYLCYFCAILTFTPGWWSGSPSPCGWWKSHQRALDGVHPGTGWPGNQTAEPPVGPCVWGPPIESHLNLPLGLARPPLSCYPPLLLNTFLPVFTLICFPNCVICVLCNRENSFLSKSPSQNDLKSLCKCYQGLQWNSNTFWMLQLRSCIGLYTGILRPSLHACTLWNSL